MPWIVGKVSDVAPGTAMQFTVEGKTVAVANVDGQFFGFSDICTHMGCPLSDGPMSGNVIMCSCHGSQFDVTSGVVVRGPAWMPLETYTVEVIGDQLQLEKVTVEEEEPAPAAVTPAAVAAAPTPPPVQREERARQEKSALEQVPLFEGLSQETLDSLQAFTFRKAFKQGDAIVEEGRTGNGLYIILSGRVQVVKARAAGSSQVVATLGPGEPFGEMALLGEWPRTASVIALEPTECLGMDRWVFMAHIRREPEMAIRMLQVLAQRLQKTDERIVE